MSIRIGIDLGGTKIEGIALEGGREVARMRADTPRDDYLATVETIALLVGALEQRAGPRAPNPESRTPNSESRIAIPSVGVGIPGTLSSATGLVKNANSVWLIGRPLLADLERRLGRDVRIANDANCFTVSEAADGAGAGAEVVFGAIVGTGTGAGIAVRGGVVTGPNGIAGEWGHNPLPWPTDDERPGPPCYCGRHGCIETFLSGPGMQADYARRTGTDRTPPEIVVDASAGDRTAQVVLARYEERMARALASVINVLDPDVIVLGGGMSNIASLYENVPRLWGPYIFAAGSRPDTPTPNLQSQLGVGSGLGVGSLGVGSYEVRTRLIRARHGDASGVRGAAWLWPAPAA